MYVAHIVREGMRGTESKDGMACPLSMLSMQRYVKCLWVRQVRVQTHVEWTDRTMCRSVFIRWIGLMINCKNLEVMADYTRYQGEDIAATVNFTKSKVSARILI